MTVKNNAKTAGMVTTTLYHNRKHLQQTTFTKQTLDNELHKFILLINFFIVSVGEEYTVLNTKMGNGELG
jgi:hypothetical protein